MKEYLLFKNLLLINFLLISTNNCYFYKVDNGQHKIIIEKQAP
ncbi:MAG: Uncharacterised protein [Crocinitomicaceae bacterium]|nr:MAG: Uncharacterised protein [Crocinitomicaceae bacterium]